MLRLVGMIALTAAAVSGAPLVNAQEVNAQVNGISRDAIAVYESNFLGHGYDVTQGVLADVESFKAPVYQVEAGWSKVLPVPKGGSNTVTGKTFQRYAHRLAASAGFSAGVGAFSGEMQASFDESSEQTQETAFMSHTEQLDYVSVELGRYYWAPGAEKDLMNLESQGGLSVERIIEKYGTHLSTNIILGGRVTASSTMQSTSSTTSQDLSVAINVSYGTASGNASFGLSSEQENRSVTEKMKVRAYGGDVKYGTRPADFAAWRASVSDRPTISRFGRDGLVPIWTLMNAPHQRERRRALRQATDEYIAKAEITDRNTNRVVKVNSKVRFRRVSNRNEVLGIRIKNELHISSYDDPSSRSNSYLFLTHPSHTVATSSNGSHIYFLKDRGSTSQGAKYSGDQSPITFDSYNPSTTADGWYLEKVEGANHSSSGRTIREFDEVLIGNWGDNSRVIGNPGNGKGMPLDKRVWPADSYTWVIEIVD